MAALALVPKNGAVALGSLVADYASFEIDSKQSVENITPYGTNVMSVNAGSGTPDWTINVGAFAIGSTNTTQINMLTQLGGLSTGLTTTATSTFTLDTGITETGKVIAESIKVSHARMKGAVPIAMVLKNAAEFTEVWSTT